MKIGTHNGVFHADEVLACAVLRRLDPACAIVRTREPKILGTCDLVVDVGGVFDASAGRFDHHQRGFEKRRPNGVPFSSAGLIWHHVGRRMVADAVFDHVDAALVQGVDALDCGVTLDAADAPCAAATFSDVISGINPTWLEAENADAAFESAVSLAGMILARAIATAEATAEAHSRVTAALDAAEGGVVELPLFLPWQGVVAGPEARRDVDFVLFPSGDGTWMVQTIPEAPGSFTPRKPLPAAWAGLRDAAFAAETGVEGAVFCHLGMFICGAGSREGARALASLAVAA